MRKICYLLCLFILTSCSKKSGVSPTTNSTTTNTTITYRFTSNVSGLYSVYYYDPNSGSSIGSEFTGQTWSKIDTINNMSLYSIVGSVPLTMNSIALNGSVTGETSTLSISVNNQVKATSDSLSANPNNPNDAVTVAYKYVIPH